MVLNFYFEIQGLSRRVRTLPRAKRPLFTATSIRGAADTCNKSYSGGRAFNSHPGPCLCVYDYDRDVGIHETVF